MPQRTSPARIVTRGLVPLGALTGLAAAFVAGTSYGTDHPDPWRSDAGSDASPAAYTGSDLSLPGSCDDLLAWYVERGVDRVGPYGWDSAYPYYGVMEDGVVTLDSARSAAGGAEQSAKGASPLPTTVRSTSGETGTNVQETGVDEPDTVKTDGRTLFRVEGGNLVTYDVTGDEVRRLGSADLPGLTDAEILLSGDTVVAIAQDGGGGGDSGPDKGSTDVVTLDVSDPASPEVTHTVEYDTELVTTRLHDGVVRVVLQAGLPDLDFAHPDKHTTDWEADPGQPGPGPRELRRGLAAHRLHRWRARRAAARLRPGRGARRRLHARDHRSGRLRRPGTSGSLGQRPGGRH